MGLFDWFRRSRPHTPEDTPARSQSDQPDDDSRAQAEALAASRAHAEGWVVLLLEDPPAVGDVGLRDWAQEWGLADKGVQVEFSAEGQARFRRGDFVATAYVGCEAFPKKHLLFFGASEQIDPGQGFIALSLGKPGGLSKDVWGPRGYLRELSRLTLTLLEAAHAVVLPQSGAVVTADTFRRRLGDVEDLRARPMAAWVSTAVDPDLKLYATYGMVLHGLPDVEVPIVMGDDWKLDRAREALLFACQKMVFSQAPLPPKSTLAVPVGISVGAVEVEVDEGDVEVYRVEVLRDGRGGLQRLVLVAVGDDMGTRALWRKASDPRAPNAELIGLNTYRELVRNQACAALKASMVSGLSPEGPALPTPFDLDVLRANDDGGFFMMTNGLGRTRQPGGHPESGTAHVELVAAMETHHTLLAGVLAQIGGQLHAHSGDEDHVYKAGDTIGFPVDELSTKGFVLRDAGRLQIAEGAPVHLLEVIPLTHDEYQQVRSLGSRAWLEAQGTMTPAKRAARWRLRLN